MPDKLCTTLFKLQGMNLKLSMKRRYSYTRTSSRLRFRVLMEAPKLSAINFSSLVGMTSIFVDCEAECKDFTI